MYKDFNEIYHFIDKFKENDLSKLNKKISIIFRNYNKKTDIALLKKIKLCCIRDKRKFYLANNIRLAISLDLDGAYIPSFNKSFRHNSYNIKKKFRIIGSAHNRKQIIIKEKQNVDAIFLSPAFMTKDKKYVSIYKFLFLKNFINKKVVALGGINQKNIKKLIMINCYEFASISFINNF